MFFGYCPLHSKSRVPDRQFGPSALAFLLKNFPFQVLDLQSSPTKQEMI